MEIERGPRWDTKARKSSRHNINNMLNLILNLRSEMRFAKLKTTSRIRSEAMMNKELTDKQSLQQQL
eukprot:857097-Heterocapsa_arctica.AAC.1